MTIWITASKAPHIARLVLTNLVTPPPSLQPNSTRLHKCWDGDCISVVSRSHVQYIRLAAIDAPECAQPWGTESAEWLHHATYGVPLKLTPTGFDRYTRTIAFVATPDIPDLSLELAKLGHAWYYTQYGQDRVDIRAAAAAARAAGTGLWSLPDPIPPWTWRHQKYPSTSPTNST